MTRTPLAGALPALVILVACSGVSPRPEDVAARQPEARELTPAQRQEVEQKVGEALHALELRRYDSAGEYARQTLAIDPGAARAHAILGHVRRHAAAAMAPPDLHLDNRADGDTQLAVRLAPDDPVVARLRATFLAATGHLSAAAAHAEAWLQAHPRLAGDDIRSLRALAGEWRYELGEERAALPHLQEVVASAEDATTWFRIGMCRLRVATSTVDPGAFADAQQAAEAAAKAFARCAELAPGDRDAWYSVATALARAAELAAQQKRGDDRARLLAEAGEQLAGVAARFGDDAEASFRLAVIHEMRGDPVAARAAHEEALRRDAGHLGSLLNLAALLLRDAQPEAKEQARQLHHRALAVDRERGGLTRQERERLLLATRP